MSDEKKEPESLGVTLFRTMNAWLDERKAAGEKVGIIDVLAATFGLSSVVLAELPPLVREDLFLNFTDTMQEDLLGTKPEGVKVN